MNKHKEKQHRSSYVRQGLPPVVVNKWTPLLVSAVISKGKSLHFFERGHRSDRVTNILRVLNDDLKKCSAVRVDQLSNLSPSKVLISQMKRQWTRVRVLPEKFQFTQEGKIKVPVLFIDVGWVDNVELADLLMTEEKEIQDILNAMTPKAPEYIVEDINLKKHLEPKLRRQLQCSTLEYFVVGYNDVNTPLVNIRMSKGKGGLKQWLQTEGYLDLKYESDSIKHEAFELSEPVLKTKQDPYYGITCTEVRSSRGGSGGAGEWFQSRERRDCGGDRDKKKVYSWKPDLNQPLCFAQSSLRDICVAGEKPRDTIVAIEKPRDILVAVEKPRDIFVAVEKPRDIFVAVEKPQNSCVSVEQPREISKIEKPIEISVTDIKPQAPIGFMQPWKLKIMKPRCASLESRDTPPKVVKLGNNRPVLVKEQDTLLKVLKQRDTLAEIPIQHDTLLKILKQRDTLAEIPKQQDTLLEIIKQRDTLVQVVAELNTPLDVMVQQNSPLQILIQQEIPLEVVTQLDTPLEVATQLNTPLEILEPLDTCAECAQPPNTSNEMKPKTPEAVKPVDHLVEVVHLENNPVEFVQLENNPVEFVQLENNPVEFVQLENNPVEFVQPLSTSHEIQPLDTILEVKEQQNCPLEIKELQESPLGIKDLRYSPLQVMNSLNTAEVVSGLEVASNSKLERGPFMEAAIVSVAGIDETDTTKKGEDCEDLNSYWAHSFSTPVVFK